MNSRKVRHSCFLVCLTVLLGSSWTAPAAITETVLKTQRFVLGLRGYGEIGWVQRECCRSRDVEGNPYGQEVRSCGQFRTV